MKKLRRLRQTLGLCLMILSVFVISASAYSVGEDAYFEADSIEGSTIGSTNTTTRTDEEKFWDNANYSNNKKVTEEATVFIESLHKVSLQEYIKNPDRIVISIGAEYPVMSLEELLSYIYKYYPGGFGYTTSDKYTGDTDIVLNDEQYGVLTGVIEDEGFNIDESATETGKIIFGLPDKLTKEELLDLLIQYELLGGEIVRESITGDIDIIDFETFEKRYEALKIYLETYSGEDTIKTQYILEIKAESVADTVLWSSMPQTWGLTGQTHFWQFECIESYDGLYHAPMQQFNGNTVSQKFYYPGKYHVSATQILEQKYYNTISYSVNQYWVVAETGQVIWKSESRGSIIPTDNNKPLEELRLSNVANYKLVNEGVYYVSVLDQEIEVTTNSHSDYLSPTGVWGFDFSTKRIE